MNRFSVSEYQIKMQCFKALEKKNKRRDFLQFYLLFFICETITTLLNPYAVKKTLLSLSLIFSTFLGFSQLQKGDRIIPINGFGQYIDNAKNENFDGTDHHLELQLNTGMAWFVAKNFAVGPALRLGYSADKVVLPAYGNPDLNRTDERSAGPTLGIGPLLRYYIPFGKSALFVHSSLLGLGALQRNTDNIRHESSTTTFRGVNAQIGVGYTYFISSNFGIEVLPAFEYLNSQYKRGSFTTYSKSDETKRWTFSIGFQWYLNKSIAETPVAKP